MSSDPIVIDAGSQSLKAGFAGEPSPRVIIPTVVGRFRRPNLEDGVPPIYCGREAMKKRGVSNLTFPVVDGKVVDWDVMEKLWHHIFYKELLVPTESLRVLHSVHPLISNKDKQRMSEIFFESFAISGLYLASSPNLVVYASGRTTGIAFENGYDCCYAAPVFEGFPLKNSLVTSPINGQALTKRLQDLMFKTGYSFTTLTQIDELNEIKRKCCYVSKDYEAELASSAAEERMKYKLPDGENLLLGEELFQCPEVLFQPSLGGLECKSITETICASIDLCDLDYRKMFYNNIVLAGGSTMFPGLPERLNMDLTNKFKRTTQDISFNVDAMPSRYLATWAGGSMLASLPNATGFWLTRAEFEDVGSERITHKFF